MKKNDFWFSSLVVLFLLGAVTGWSFWACVAVIANAVVVLADVILQILQFTQKGRHENGR